MRGSGESLTSRPRLQVSPILLGFARELAATFRSLRQTQSVPPAPKGLDQQHGVRHTTAQNIDGSHFIRKRRALRSNYLEITCDSTPVANDRKIERSLRRRDGFILDLSFVFKDSHRREIVFDLLKSGEHAFAIGSDLIVIGGTRLIVERTPSSTVEHSPQSRQSN